MFVIPAYPCCSSKSVTLKSPDHFLNEMAEGIRCAVGRIVACEWQMDEAGRASVGLLAEEFQGREKELVAEVAARIVREDDLVALRHEEGVEYFQRQRRGQAGGRSREDESIGGLSAGDVRNGEIKTVPSRGLQADFLTARRLAEHDEGIGPDFS